MLAFSLGLPILRLGLGDASLKPRGRMLHSVSPNVPPGSDGAGVSDEGLATGWRWAGRREMEGLTRGDWEG